MALRPERKDAGSNPQLRLRCVRLADRAAISATALRFARRLGFDERASWEIGISVQELASNMIRHAGGGYLEIDVGEHWLEILATDAGPGIPEVKLKESETSTRGLGAIRRLMHELEVSALASGGARVRARRYMDRKR